MKYLLVLTLAFLTITSGCDPMRRIRMTNQTGEEASVVWMIKEDSINSSPLFISSDKVVRFDLDTKTPGRSINMSFGIGTWTPKVLRNFVDDLDTLKISWKNQEIVLDSEEKIMNYLLPRRAGLGKDKIRITLKE